MRFRHSVLVTVDNFAGVFKYLLYRVITGIVFFSLIYVVLRLSLSFIVDSAEVAAIKELIRDIVTSIFSGNAQHLADLQEQGVFSEAIGNLGRLVVSGGGAIAGAVVGVCLIYLVARIVDGLATFALATMLNDRMSICARTPFSSAFFKSAGRGILYELIYVPMSFVYDAATLGFCYLIFFYLRGLVFGSGLFVVLVSLSLTILSFVLSEALKMTLISAWIPAMLADNEGVTKALRRSFCARHAFETRFVCFVTAIFIIIVANIAFGVFTFGSALLITVPLSFLFTLSIQFVFYYHETGRKYFVSAGEVVSTEETKIEEKTQI